jgi:hypothetical protein
MTPAPIAPRAGGDSPANGDFFPKIPIRSATVVRPVVRPVSNDPGERPMTSRKSRIQRKFRLESLERREALSGGAVPVYYYYAPPPVIPIVQPHGGGQNGGGHNSGGLDTPQPKT